MNTIKIAVCDDCQQDLQAFSAMLSAYGEKTGALIHCSVFSDADSLLCALRGGVQFDAMFLDILMPSLTGIEAARELRQSGDSTDLIFLTVSRDFALDAFSVKAKDYLIKPLSETMFFQLLDDLKAKLDENETILIAGKKSFRRLRPDRIEYCEVRGHSIFWNLRSGAVLESRGSMEEAEELLSSSGFFLRVHRSYLVNQYCIASFDWQSRTIELDSMMHIPVPKAKFSAVREQYLDMMKGEKPT